jgi:fibronectin-binding autotransporter adhesin
VTFTGNSALEGAFTGTLANSLTINSGLSPTLEATSGNTFTLASSSIAFEGGAGTTVHFGSAADTGTMVLAPTGVVTAAPAGAASIDGGTVKLGNPLGSAVISGLEGGLTVGSGTAQATLDLNGQPTTAWNLTGNANGVITSTGGAATVFTENAANTTFAGVIQDGAGGTGQVSLVVEGPSTLALSGANTYTGGTTISAGTLQLGAGGATGSIVGNVADNGTLAFDRSDTMTFGGVISGTGSLAQLGAGTTILTGANTNTGGTTISAGTLQIGAGGATGSIVGNVGDNGTLAFDRSDTMTFGGVVSGTGSLAQSGAGTTILAGANTYSGGTTISAGTLQIGNGGTTGSILGNVLDNSALAFDRSDNLTFGGVIGGTARSRNWARAQRS